MKFVRTALLAWKQREKLLETLDNGYRNERCFIDSLTWYIATRATELDQELSRDSLVSLINESERIMVVLSLVDQKAKNLSEKTPTTFSKLQSHKTVTVQFESPGGDNIVDLIVRGTIHSDAIPLCESSSRARSVEIISFTIRNCNPIVQSSRAFIHYLSIVSAYESSKKDSVYSKAFNEILKTTTTLGKYGCFFNKNGVWYHLRWYVDSILVDYHALHQLAKHGNQSSNLPCVHCGVRKQIFNPFFNALLLSSWPQIFNCGVMKTMQSSLFFTAPKSLYRIHSVVGSSILKSKKKGAQDRITREFPQLSATDLEELKQMYQDFSMVDTSYLLMWRPLPLSVKVNLWRVTKLITGDTTISLEGCDQLNSKMRELNLPPEVEYNDGDNKCKRDMTLLHRYGMYSLDMMHLLSNYIIRCSSCLNNLLSVRKDLTYLKSFSKIFNSFLFTSSISNKQDLFHCA